MEKAPEIEENSDDQITDGSLSIKNATSADLPSMTGAMANEAYTLEVHKPKAEIDNAKDKPETIYSELKEIQDSKEKERSLEEVRSKRGGILTRILTNKIVSNGLDFVPYVGGVKMLVESIAGTTLHREKLTTKERIIHAAVGASVLAMDVLLPGLGTAGGEGVTIAGKSIPLLEKLAAKTAQKGALRSSKIFERVALFIAEHPKLLQKTEEIAQNRIKSFIRKNRNYREGGEMTSAT